VRALRAAFLLAMDAFCGWREASRAGAMRRRAEAEAEKQARAEAEDRAVRDRVATLLSCLAAWRAAADEGAEARERERAAAAMRCRWLAWRALAGWAAAAEDQRAEQALEAEVDGYWRERAMSRVLVLWREIAVAGDVATARERRRRSLLTRGIAGWRGARSAREAQEARRDAALATAAATGLPRRRVLRGALLAWHAETEEAGAALAAAARRRVLLGASLGTLWAHGRARAHSREAGILADGWRWKRLKEKGLAGLADHAAAAVQARADDARTLRAALLGWHGEARRAIEAAEEDRRVAAREAMRDRRDAAAADSLRSARLLRSALFGWHELASGAGARRALVASRALSAWRAATENARRLARLGDIANRRADAGRLRRAMDVWADAAADAREARICASEAIEAEAADRERQERNRETERFERARRLTTEVAEARAAAAAAAEAAEAALREAADGRRAAEVAAMAPHRPREEVAPPGTPPRSRSPPQVLIAMEAALRSLGERVAALAAGGRRGEGEGDGVEETAAVETPVEAHAANATATALTATSSTEMPPARVLVAASKADASTSPTPTPLPQMLSVAATPAASPSRVAVVVKGLSHYRGPTSVAATPATLPAAPRPSRGGLLSPPADDAVLPGPNVPPSVLAAALAPRLEALDDIASRLEAAAAAQPPSPPPTAPTSPVAGAVVPALAASASAPLRGSRLEPRRALWLDMAADSLLPCDGVAAVPPPGGWDALTAPVATDVVPPAAPAVPIPAPPRRPSRHHRAPLPRGEQARLRALLAAEARWAEDALGAWARARDAGDATGEEGARPLAQAAAERAREIGETLRALDWAVTKGRDLDRQK